VSAVGPLEAAKNPTRDLSKNLMKLSLFFHSGTSIRIRMADAARGATNRGGEGGDPGPGPEGCSRPDVRAGMLAGSRGDLRAECTRAVTRERAADPSRKARYFFTTMFVRTSAIT